MGEAASSRSGRPSSRFLWSMACALAAVASTTISAIIAILIMAAPSMLVTRVWRFRRRRLRLITGRRGARQNFMHGWWPWPHVHAGMPLGILLVEIGIPVVGAMVPVQIDRKNLEDRSPLCFEAGKEIRSRQDVVAVVVQHVEVVEDRGGFGEPLAEIRSRLRHHRHESPLHRRPAEIAVVEGDDFRHQ